VTPVTAPIDAVWSKVRPISPNQRQTLRTRRGGGERKSATSDENGRFGFPLLPPGKYELQASKQDFEPVSLPEITIHITEILRLELHLRLAMRFERAQVSSNPRCRIPHEIEGYP
jgi:hypothetical protein